MELKIYKQGGALKVTVSPADSSTHTHELMGENVVSVTFTYPEYLTLDVNDYVELEGKQYVLRSASEPVQKSTLEYTYNVKFYGRESEMIRVRMLHLTDGEYETKFSLDGSPREHLKKVVENLNRINEGAWFMGTVMEAPNQNIEYSNLSCAEALSRITETFDTEWWVEGNTLNLCRCEIGTPVDLGYLQGLTELTRADNENVPFFTRLIPLGSTRNINRSKYGHVRLQLPGGARFMDQNTHYGLFEAVEEQAFAGIYPRRVGTVTSVHADEKTGEEGKKFTVYYFQDAGMDFDPNQYNLPGLVKHVVFQSGELNGRDFEVNYNNDTHEFEIINQYPDENSQLPGRHLIPNPTDSYILYNMEMPAEYITAAEVEFKTAVETYLAKYSIDNAIYRGNTDYIHIDRNEILLCVGRRVRLLSDNYFKEVGYRDSRITRITRNLSCLSKATIECTNAVGKGRLAAIESNVNEIKTIIADRLDDAALTVLHTWDSGDITDANVLSSLRSVREINKRALRKDQPDETDYLVKLLDGAEFGEYAPGFTGTGARINEDGMAEMAGLRLREFLEVPELRFNRIDVVSGELWNAIAFGLIESVDTEYQIVTLKLEEGELLGVHLNDFCRGIFHNLAGNADASVVDACGFSTLPGFSTAYFTPKEILSDGKSFRYALKPGTTVHPCKAMKFAVYGNATDKGRQASSYATRTYKRYLYRVDTWVTGERNIAMQFGDCSGLSIGGVDMSGYSAYLNNIYLTGVINWLEEHKDEFRGSDAYTVSLSTYESVVVIDEDGYIVSDLYRDYNVVSSEENVVAGDQNVTATRYEISTRIQVFRGSNELLYGTLTEEGYYLVQVNAHGCEYTLSGGVITVTRVTDVASAYMDIEINCEGVAVFTKHYQVTAIYGNSVWATYHDSESLPGKPVGDGTTEGWHRSLTDTSVWMSQKNSRLITDGEWGDPIRLKGKDGILYMLDLSNENASVACDYTGNVVGQIPSSKATVYCGASIDDGWTFTGEYSGCTGTVNEVTGDITVTALYVDNASVRVIARKTNKSDMEAIYTIVKVRAGTNGLDAVIYWLEPSVSVVKKDMNATLTPASVSCTKMKQVGNGLASVTYEYTLKYQLSNGAETNYTGAVVMGTATWIDFILYDGITVLDKERVLIVSDGKAGTDGKDGVSGYVLNLDNENASVLCEADGTPVSGVQFPACKVSLYQGSVRQVWDIYFRYVVDGCTISVPTNSYTQSTSFSVTGITKNVATVTVTASVVDIPVGVATMNITKVCGGSDAVIYWLEPSVSVVKKDKDGVIIPTAVSCTKMKQVGNNKAVVTSEKTLKYQLSNGVETVYTSAVGVGTAAWIDFILYDGNVVLDKERIPVVSDGAEGKTGPSGKDANMLPWIENWNTNKTLIDGEYVISPKMFSGMRDEDGKLTGVAFGRECVIIDGVKRTGIFGIVNDEVIFALDPITKKYLFKGDIYTPPLYITYNNIENYGRLTRTPPAQVFSYDVDLKKAGLNIQIGSMKYGAGTPENPYFVFGYPSLILPRSLEHKGAELNVIVTDPETLCFVGGISHYSNNIISRSSVSLEAFRQYTFKCVVFDTVPGYSYSLVNGKAVEWIEV